MFNFFKKVNTTQEELFIKEKNLIEKELDLYKKEKMYEIDLMVLNYKRVKEKEMLDLSLECNRQIGENEHKYHSTMEKLGIDIAKLTATKENLEQQINTINLKLLRK